MKITKRDGAVVSWHRRKIEDAILKAVAAANANYAVRIRDEAAGIMAKAVADCISWHAEQLAFKDEIIGIEYVQDRVEYELSRRSFYVTKAYILYRENRRKERKE